MIAQTWFPDLPRKAKIKTSSNAKKCISFCLQLNKMSGICVKEFLELNWFNVHDRYLQLIASDTFKFYNISVLATLMKLSALLTIME